MTRFFGSLITAVMLGVSALPALAQVAPTGPLPTAPAAACPATAGRAVAVAFGSGFYRADLQQAALRAVSAAAQQAGVMVVAPQAAVLQAIPGTVSAMPLPVMSTTGTPQPTALCIPTLVLVMSTGTPSSVTFVITRSSERIAVGGALEMPSGHTFQAISQQTATWYGGYLPAPYVPNLPVLIGGIPVGTPQDGAEQKAVEHGVAAVLATLLPDIAH